MSAIQIVHVYLEQDMPESMRGVIRIESVVSDEKTSHEELVDNTEFHSSDQVIAHVAEALGVSPDIIEIVE